MKLVNIFQALIICYLLGLLSFREGEVSSSSDRPNDELRLNKIDIAPNSLILEIFKDVISDSVDSKSGRLFTFQLKDYKSGEKVYVVQELDHNIDAFNDVLGYTIIDKDTVVFYGKHITDFRFCKNPSPICFQVNKHMRSDHPEWVYFIKDGIFARDGESMGWIWNIPKDSLKNYEFKKYFISAPYRTKK